MNKPFIAAMDHSKLKFICTAKELETFDYLVRPIEYRKQPFTAIIFNFKGSIYAYLNHCMHMRRRLDCEADTIFDATGHLLHCSMHGFIFDPVTGECLSPVCAGQKLQALKIVELDEGIYFADKHVRLAD